MTSDYIAKIDSDGFCLFKLLVFLVFAIDMEFTKKHVRMKNIVDYEDIIENIYEDNIKFVTVKTKTYFLIKNVDLWLFILLVKWKIEFLQKH